MDFFFYSIHPLATYSWLAFNYAGIFWKISLFKTHLFPANRLFKQDLASICRQILLYTWKNGFLEKGSKHDFSKRTFRRFIGAESHYYLSSINFFNFFIYQLDKSDFDWWCDLTQILMRENLGQFLKNVSRTIWALKEIFL